MTATYLAATHLMPLLANTGESCVFSPLSLIHALAILVNLGEGAAIDQLEQVFGLSKYDPAGAHKFSVQLAADIFMRHMQLSPDYQKRIQKLFDCTPEELKSAQQVNKWVEQHTNGMIKNLVDSIDGIDAILLSAVYFKQKFKNPFDANLTREEAFHAFGGTKSVRMMHQKQKKLRFAKTGTAMIAELPYENSVVARVILPLDSTEAAFKTAVSKENLQASLFSTNVVLSMPKMSIESRFSLKSALAKIGCAQMFSSVDCEKSLKHQMQVDDVLQKARVEVDEQGTEAAAATAVMMRMMSCGVVPESVVMQCDRPFWFVLMDGQEVLFVVGFQG